MFVERAKCVCMLVNNIYCMFSSFLLKEQSVGHVCQENTVHVRACQEKYSVYSRLSREIQCMFMLVERIQQVFKLGKRRRCKFMFVRSTCCSLTLLQRMQCIFMLVERKQWVLCWVWEQSASSCLSKVHVVRQHFSRECSVYLCLWKECSGCYAG